MALSIIIQCSPQNNFTEQLFYILFSGNTEHDMNVNFQHAARNVLLEDDSLLKHFSLVIKDNKKHLKTMTGDDKKQKQVSYFSVSLNCQWQDIKKVAAIWSIAINAVSLAILYVKLLF